MKNIVIAILTVVLIVVGYTQLVKLRLPTPGEEGVTAKVIRGDLTLPINATGEVKPALRIEIKSEASGAVIEIAHKAGDRVHAGDLIIRLQPDEEQRSVDRATQELAIANARLNTARLRRDLAKGAELDAAKARVDELDPAVEYAKFRKEKVEALDAVQRNDEELLQRDSDYRRQLAQLDAARAAYKKAELAIPLSENAVTEADSAHEAAKSTLADAEKRLRETNVVSPIDGVLADVKVQIGSVIQGGKTTFTGGTVLAIVLDMDRLLVQAEVDESDIGRVLAIAPEWAKPGHDGSVQMPADLAQAVAAVEHPPEITVESFRDETFTGVIERIFPEPKSGGGVVTYLVDVVVTSENRQRLLSGMRADVSFTSEHVTNVILCSNEAIKEGPRGKLGVYIPKKGADPKVRLDEFVQCRLGLDNGVYSEVIEGLNEGDIVYTKRPKRRSEDDES
jgi:multidrug efflux pump subunit AcrA (membrane-fusion protein)